MKEQKVAVVPGEAFGAGCCDKRDGSPEARGVFGHLLEYVTGI